MRPSKSRSALRLPRTASAAALAAALLGLPAAALASPTFPEAVQTELDMACPPPCTLCHRDLNGGFGTVEKKFGMAMQAAGLTFGQPAEVPAALTRLETDGTDSDADGKADVAELREGEDPNGGEGSLCEGPRYGCGASVATGAPGAASALALAPLAIAAAALALRKRRSRA